MLTKQEAHDRLDQIEHIWHKYNYGDLGTIDRVRTFLDMTPEGIPFPDITSEFRNPNNKDFTQVLVLLWTDVALCRSEGALMFTSIHVMADANLRDDVLWYTINGITGEEQTHSLDLLSFPSYLTDTIKNVLGL